MPDEKLASQPGGEAGVKTLDGRQWRRTLERPLRNRLSLGMLESLAIGSGLGREMPDLNRPAPRLDDEPVHAPCGTSRQAQGKRQPADGRDRTAPAKQGC